MQDERSGERAPAKGGTTDVVAPDTVDSDASTTDPASDGTVSDGTASDDTTGDEPSEVADQETPANPDAHAGDGSADDERADDEHAADASDEEPRGDEPEPTRDEAADEVAHTSDGLVVPAHAAPTGAETIPAAEVHSPERDHEHDERGRSRVSLPPTLTLLLGLAATVVAIAGLKQVAGIIAPTFLAATLIIAVYPIYKVLRRFLGGAIAGLLLIVILYGILAALGASIGIAASKFATELAEPEYTSTFTGLVSDGREFLNSQGIEAEEIDEAIANFDLRNLTGLASSLANTVTGLTTTMLFLLTVMIFLVMDAGGFGHRLAAIHRHKPDVADALVDFGYRVRKYWIVSTVFGVIVAVIDYAALMWLGVPLAMTFGLLSFVTNYIPNIGFVLGLIPPAFIALLSGGVSTMVWVIVIYCVANFVIQTILQPKFTGDAVGINATTAFLSLMFWAYVFGALGALLAIPFTLLFKSLLIDRDPNNRWVNQFIASSPREGTSAQPL